MKKKGGWGAEKKYYTIHNRQKGSDKSHFILRQKHRERGTQRETERETHTHRGFPPPEGSSNSIHV